MNNTQVSMHIIKCVYIVEDFECQSKWLILIIENVTLIHNLSTVIVVVVCFHCVLFAATFWKPLLFAWTSTVYVIDANNRLI